MLRLLAIVTLILAATGAARLGAHAAPIGVRAASRLELQPRFEDDTWVLVLTLSTDDGTPVPLAPVSFTVAEGPPVALATDADGRTAHRIPASRLRKASPALAWTARFPGTHSAAPAEFSGIVDLARMPARLTITSDATYFDLRSRPASFLVSLATAEQVPAAITAATVRIRIDNGPFQHARTDTSGRLAFVVDPALLPSESLDARDLGVEVIFDGDAIHAGARATLSIPRRVISRLTLRVAREGDANLGRLRFSGRASHEFGAWPDVPVRVMVTTPEGRILFAMPTITSATGVWNAAIPLDVLRDTDAPRVSVAAHVAPAGQVQGAETTPLLLEVPRAPGRSALVPILLVAAIVLATRLFDAQKRRAFLAHGRGACHAIARAFARFVHLFSPREPTRPEIAARRAMVAPSLSGTRQRTDIISIRLCDQDSKSPVSANISVVWLPRDGEASATQHTAADSFEFQSSSPGTCRLDIAGPGMIPASLAISLPHDGGWDGAVVSVRRVERRLRELHENLGRRLGARLAWGRDTPRDLLRQPSTRTDGSVDAVVDAVERAYFGQTPVSPDELARIESMVLQQTSSLVPAPASRESGGA